VRKSTVGDKYSTRDLIYDVIYCASNCFRSLARGRNA